MSSAAQQLLCACISAVMRSPNTCCASGYQLVGDIFYIISLSSVRRSDGLQSPYPPSGVPTDLQSVVKKWPNLFMFCGFAIRSREIVICYGLGGLQIPWFDRSNLFLRRISNPSGRLTGVWDGCRGDERHIRWGGIVLLSNIGKFYGFSNFCVFFLEFSEKNRKFAIRCVSWDRIESDIGYIW